MASGILGGIGQFTGGFDADMALQKQMMIAQANGMRNSIQPAPPTSPMECHAGNLHKLAEELQQLNIRFSSAIDRITGPIPEPVGNSKDYPEPGKGSLLVAQFGAERINTGVSRLAELITRLEGIV